MRPEQWTEQVLTVVRKIADRAYQQNAWFAGGGVISSPEELVCGLFDDSMYDEFLSSPDVVLTPAQRQLGEQLKLRLNHYIESMGDVVDPADVIDSEAWIDVRNAAGRFLNTFE